MYIHEVYTDIFLCFVPSQTTVPSTLAFINQYVICESTIYEPGFIPTPHLLCILSIWPLDVALLVTWKAVYAVIDCSPVFLFVRLVHVMGTVVCWCSVFHSWTIWQVRWSEVAFKFLFLMRLFHSRALENAGRNLRWTPQSVLWEEVWTWLATFGSNVFRNKSKGEVHSYTSTEALYRLYGPQGE